MTPAHVFSSEFWEIFKNTFFTEHLRATAPAFQKLQYNIFQNEMLGWINIIFYFSSKNKWCLLKAKVSNLYEVK